MRRFVCSLNARTPSEGDARSVFDTPAGAATAYLRKCGPADMFRGPFFWKTPRYIHLHSESGNELEGKENAFVAQPFEPFR